MIITRTLLSLSEEKRYAIYSAAHICINPRTYKETHTPTMVQGGGVGVVGTPPLGFRSLQDKMIICCP